MGDGVVFFYMYTPYTLIYVESVAPDNPEHPHSLIQEPHWPPICKQSGILQLADGVALRPDCVQKQSDSEQCCPHMTIKLIQ